MEQFESDMFKIGYSPFGCGSNLVCYSKDRMTETIYEYSQARGELKLYDQKLKVKETYEIPISNVSLIVIWGVFLIVVHQEGAKLVFSLLSRETLKNLQSESIQTDLNKSDLKYFTKPFLHNEIVMENIFDHKDNVNYSLE